MVALTVLLGQALAGESINTVKTPRDAEFIPTSRQGPTWRLPGRKRDTRGLPCGRYCRASILPPGYSVGVSVRVCVCALPAECLAVCLK